MPIIALIVWCAIGFCLGGVGGLVIAIILFLIAKVIAYSLMTIV